MYHKVNQCDAVKNYIISLYDLKIKSVAKGRRFLQFYKFKVNGEEYEWVILEQK